LGSGQCPEPVYIFMISIKGLHKKAWKQQSKVRRMIEKNICYTCEKPTGSQLGHCEHGDSLDFDYHDGTWTKPRWLRTQCSGCNLFRNGKQVVFAAKLVKEYGPEILEIMLKQKHDVRKWKRDELEEIYKEYKELETTLMA